MVETARKGEATTTARLQTNTMKYLGVNYESFTLQKYINNYERTITVNQLINQLVFSLVNYFVMKLKAIIDSSGYFNKVKWSLRSLWQVEIVLFLYISPKPNFTWNGSLFLM